MNIIENIIDKSLQDAIESVVTSCRFPWFYGHTVEYENIEEEDNAYIFTEGYNPQQFVHNVVVDSQENSEYYNLISAIIDNCVNDHIKSNIEVKRAKFNLLTNDSKLMHHWPHVDIGSKDLGKIKTLLYYVNDSDGDTYFFDDIAPKTKTKLTVTDQVTPKKGTAVIFDSDIFHASSSPNVSSKRIVLNIVFKILD